MQPPNTSPMKMQISGSPGIGQTGTHLQSISTPGGTPIQIMTQPPLAVADGVASVELANNNTATVNPNRAAPRVTPTSRFP